MGWCEKWGGVRGGKVLGWCERCGGVRICKAVGWCERCGGVRGWVVREVSLIDGWQGIWVV